LLACQMWGFIDVWEGTHDLREMPPFVEWSGSGPVETATPACSPLGTATALKLEESNQNTYGLPNTRKDLMSSCYCAAEHTNSTQRHAYSAQNLASH